MVNVRVFVCSLVGKGKKNIHALSGIPARDPVLRALKANAGDCGCTGSAEASCEGRLWRYS